MKMMRLNLALFILFVIVALVSTFVDFRPKALIVPEATTVYQERYTILDKRRVSSHIADSIRSVAMIIVDAWGVPLDQSILDEDLGVFKNLPHQFAIHNRLRNKTIHAEKVEIKEDFAQVDYEELDSLLADSTYKRVATTIHLSRGGDLDSLRLGLAQIADLMKKYPETIFIIQGAHRPILGTPETRKMYYAHWVPVVIGNYELP